MQTGALIVAAGRPREMDAFRPLLKLGGTTLIQKEIDTLRRANVSPIAVVTGYEAETLEKHLAHRGVVCLRNDRYEETEMLDSVKIGLRYLQDQCDRILFLPADSPLFSSDSLEKVMAVRARVAIPYYEDRSGHPILLHRSVFPEILAYDGEEGLRGAIRNCSVLPQEVPVSDEGILLEVNSEEQYRKALDYEKKSLESRQLTFQVRLTMKKTDAFFGPGLADFLELIEEEGSMLAACKIMEMSYSKGWKMIKSAEENLGFPFLERKAGGSGGGNSRMTDKGRRFLMNYRAMQRDIQHSAEAFFHMYFPGERKES